MKRFFKVVYTLDLSLQVVAGLGLAFMMVVTLIDVTMRFLGKPIIGAIEGRSAFPAPLWSVSPSPTPPG